MAPFLYFADRKETVYTLVPTLEHIAALRIVIDQYNRNEIRLFLDKLRFSRIGRFDPQPDETFDHVREAVECNVRSCLHTIPEELINKVLAFVAPTTQEIYYWKEYHELRFEESLDNDLLLPDELYWTVHGTIDRKKTAQALVRDPRICIMLRFKFACAYCLESDIRALWDRMPELCRVYLSRDEHDRITGFCQSEDSEGLETWKQLLCLWCLSMNGDLDFGRMFRHAVGREFLIEQVDGGCAQEVLDYFLPKLTLTAKGEFIQAIATSFTTHTCLMDSRPRVFFFLLSQLNGEQQRIVFGDNGVRHLIDICTIWPWHDLATHIFRHLQYFLPVYEYKFILSIVYGMVRGLEIFYPKFYNYYQPVFENALELFSGIDNNVFLEPNYATECLLDQMIEAGDKNNIMLVWNYATAAQREDIICYFGKPSTRPSIEKKRKNMYPFLMGLVS